MDPASPEFSTESRPTFYIGQHDTKRHETLTDAEYGRVLNSGFNFVTTPITNDFFRKRIVALVAGHLSKKDGGEADPIVTPLTTIDTTLFPSPATAGMVACSAAWIDLCSKNHVIANVSRQVLNIEIAYASFVGVRTVIVPGPNVDNDTSGSSQAIAQYARAVYEALNIGGRLNLVIHMPMYREPGLDEGTTSLSDLEVATSSEGPDDGPVQIELFGAWDAWHQIRTASDYCNRLGVALRLPSLLPEKDLQARWFAEPLQYLTLAPGTFTLNKAGHPSLSRYHQTLINSYMTLKNHPYFILYDVGPDLSKPPPQQSPQSDTAATTPATDDFPTLQEAASVVSVPQKRQQPTSEKLNPYVANLRHVEMNQPPYSYLESNALLNFQDYLQSPLQPLSDNLDSQTYEIFEKDPVKYVQYEKAITMALKEWSHQRRPTSSPRGAVVIAVAGSGRGPLVTRALGASAATGVAVEVWAVEKNPNAYVYLLRQNETIWNERVTVVRTDMRAWKGPLLNKEAVEGDEAEPKYGKVDILVSELLGSFGDNELSPECLDGIQHVLAPHGISIPKSYTAHLTPIATPKLHADVGARFATDKNAYSTPWVVRLFAHDFVVAKGVPHHPRFQRAWEFKHPLPEAVAEAIEIKRGGGTAGGCGGAMSGSAGFNDHNSRYCHLTFVCRVRGVVHGLAGYFESTLYEKTIRVRKDPEDEEFDGDDDVVAPEMVELSILPEQMDKKNKDMISWFPIFFPLRSPLYYPADTELEVSMWRQTDDTKVWYEWKVDAFTWVGTATRIRVGGSELCTSRNVACLM